MSILSDLPVREWGARIGGHEVTPRPGRRLVRTMPGHPDREVGTFRFCDASDVARAVETVLIAQKTWAVLRPKERSTVLHRAAHLLAARADELATWECLESGMLIDLAYEHVGWCVELLEFYAGLARALTGRTVSLGGTKLGLVLPEPVGVVAALGPWNFPLSELIWKVAPALAAGCGVVMKPAELTPVTSFILDEVLHEAGVPPGLTAVVTGDREVGEALVGHPQVGLVSLTGGSATGRAVLRTAAEHITPTLMELGGKSPVIVLPHAPADETADIVGAAVGFRSGQACVCPSRVISVGGRARARELADALDAYFALQVMGPPEETTTTIGPMITGEHARGVRAHLDAAVARGVVMIHSQQDVGDDLIAPKVALIDDARDPLAQDEIFGPVTVLLQAGTIDDAVHLANDTRYGLSAGVISGGDLDAALAIAREVQAGTVWIDEWGTIELEVPFGGVRESGFGRELAMEGLEAFVWWKSVHLPHRQVGAPVHPPPPPD